MQKSLAQMTPEERETRLVARRARWRRYYYEHHEERLAAGKITKAKALAKETPEQREHRLEVTRKWHQAHPDYKSRTDNPEYRKAWREKTKAKDPEEWRRQMSGYRLKGLYGITRERYWQMYEDQGGVCAICRQPETMTIKGTLCLLSVDHDHRHCPGQKSCGKCVRALLCNRCNRMVLAGAGHDTSVLLAAVDYLNRWP